MKFGIKQKILLLLVALLSITITTLALLAGYSTSRQNESAAFTHLDRDLLSWQARLAHSVVRLREVSQREVSDPASLALLSRLLMLQFKAGDPRGAATSPELSRSLGYEKSVALGRMLLVLRTGGFDSIGVYLHGRLSHLVSTSRGGMMITRADPPGEVWISAAETAPGGLPLQDWPAWQPGTPPPDIALTLDSPALPTVYFSFPTPEVTAIEIAIPVLGRTQDITSDRDKSVDRFVSDLSVPDTSHDEGALAQPLSPLAVVVFRKLIDRAALQEILERTGHSAAIYSLDGTHNQPFAVRLPFGPELSLRTDAPAGTGSRSFARVPAGTDSRSFARVPAGTGSRSFARPGAPATPAPALHRTVNTPDGSYYQVLVPWEFEHRARFILSLAASRTPTLHNVSQTLTAILWVAGCILALSVAVGAFWVRRFIDPIVTLTDAAKTIERRSHAAYATNTPSAAELRPLDIQASDEVGDLAAAFNAMIAALRRSIETLEQRVQERTAEAMRLARARSDFLAQMSHELRTPLNGILGYAQILRRDRNLDARAARGLATIHDSGQHLLNLINDILDLARMDAAKLQLSPTVVELETFLQGVTNIMRVKAEEKGLQFTIQAAPDLPPAVRVDPKRLRQILLNLLGNAVKFTDSGGLTLRVQTLSPAKPSGAYRDELPHARLRFEVEDTGIGMPADQQGRIFLPFEQLGEYKRREGGSGLGLAITNALLHLMGGEIRLLSEPGKGSRFWFELDLPLVQRSVTEQPLRTVISYEGSRKKILVVDDVVASRMMMRDVLTSVGFTVFDAVSGQEALARIPLVKPDLVLMDLMMPHMDGCEATRRIRQLPGFERLPIIVVSASAGPEEHVKCSAAGANAFHPKPIDHDALVQTIGEQLGLHWLYREDARAL